MTTAKPLDLAANYVQFAYKKGSSEVSRSHTMKIAPTVDDLLKGFPKKGHDIDTIPGTPKRMDLRWLYFLLKKKVMLRLLIIICAQNPIVIVRIYPHTYHTYVCSIVHTYELSYIRMTHLTHKSTTNT